MSPRQQTPLTIEHALLGFVPQEPLHAYAIFQRISAPEALGRVWQLKQSHFYALVRKLEEAGYLGATLEPQGTRPPRKLLHLTEAGAAAFARWRSTPIDDPTQLRLDFLTRLYFAERAGPAATRALLVAQLRTIRNLRDALRSQLPRRFSQPDAGIFLQLRIRQLESVLAWIERTLAVPAPPSAVSYSIALIADSLEPTLAAAFVDAVRSPSGQAALLQAGFQPLVETFLERPPLGAPAPSPAASSEHILTVFAAASLSGPFQAIGADFCTANPGLKLRFSFGGSYALAAQLSRGMPADVFAPAHRQAMELAVHAGRVWQESVSVFATNQLAVVTPRSNPARLLTLDDLARPGLKLALGSESSAIGQYTRELLRQVESRGFFGDQGKDAVLRNVVRYGADVAEVLASVAHGEVDAGIVFASDGRQAGADVQVPMALPALSLTH